MEALQILYVILVCANNKADPSVAHFELVLAGPRFQAYIEDKELELEVGANRGPLKCSGIRGLLPCFSRCRMKSTWHPG